MTKHIHITKKANLIAAPPSKSYAQRALFAAALTNSTARIQNLGHSDDVLHIKAIIQQLGFLIKDKNTLSILQPLKKPSGNTINVGESGLGTRLAVPILSHFYKAYTVVGEGTLLNRPMTWFKDYLPQMGLDITLNNNRLPIYATGEIKSGQYKVDGSESSQYISGLLMTLPLCGGESIIEVSNSTSIPYIDITLSILTDFGIEITHDNYEKYYIKGNQKYKLKADSYSVEGDYSGAAFWIVYGLLNAGISISNLNPNSVQADKAILEVVKKVGGHFEWKNEILSIFPPEKLIPFDFDARHCPDLFPALAILAAGIIGTSNIHGLNRLLHKESNRKAVILEEFSKLGVEMKTPLNSLQITGTGKLRSSSVNVHNDHRIAMAAAIASVLTKSGITISDPHCVNKSYPNFWETTFIL